MSSGVSKKVISYEIEIDQSRLAFMKRFLYGKSNDIPFTNGKTATSFQLGELTKSQIQEIAGF